MRIKELVLYTSKLKEQSAFYSEVLELEMINKLAESASFKIGDSILTFISSRDATPYHYAINIPSNKKEEALEWLKNRVEVLKNNESEIQYFDYWDANAIYFYDKEDNIVELIARNSLNNTSNKPFDVCSLLEISEIGVATLNIKEDFRVLNNVTNIPIHSGNFDRFMSIGNDNGLFILINKNLKKEWFPTKDKPYSSDFRIHLIEQGKKYEFNYFNEEFKLVV